MKHCWPSKANSSTLKSELMNQLPSPKQSGQITSSQSQGQPVVLAREHTEVQYENLCVEVNSQSREKIASFKLYHIRCCVVTSAFYRDLSQNLLMVCVTYYGVEWYIKFLLTRVWLCMSGVVTSEETLKTNTWFTSTLKESGKTMHLCRIIHLQQFNLRRVNMFNLFFPF